MAIDYDQLRIAHELAEKIDGFCEFTIYANACSADLFKINYDKVGLSFKHNECYLNIDNLIAKLRELTKPESKYKAGDMAWVVDCDEICTAFVSEYINDEYKLYNCVTISGIPTGKDWAQEYELYPTKQSLIEAQIEHWTKLKSDHSEDKVECQHQDDGKIYFTKPPKTRCIKCGEFYR